MKIQIHEIKSIIIVNLGGIGDILLSIPALHALRRRWTDASIVLLTVPRLGSLVDNVGLVDKIIFWDLSLGGFLKLTGFFRENKFDLAINMRTINSFISALKIAVLFSLIGAGYRAGRDTEGRGFFLNIKVPEADRAKMHDMDYNLEIVKALGLEIFDKKIELKTADKDREYMGTLLRQNDITKDDVLIGINPGGTYATKHWPIENFASLVKELSENRKYKIILVGSQNEIPRAERIKALSKTKVLDCTGRTTVGQLSALIEKCNLFISNDAGPMHIAAILGTPLVAIFGSSDPVRFGPCGEPEKISVLYKKTDCAPCVKKRCSSMTCFRNIAPEEVKNAAISLLKKHEIT